MFTLSILSKNALDLEQQINEIESYTVNKDWSSAEESLSIIEENWNKVEKTWAVLLDHMEIDNIDISLIKMAEYIKTKDSALALAEISALKQYVKHIPEKESFNLKNLF
ncbi:MAG: DUF4363 family protein [Clostridiaceae bacterium]|nr:DUF4363 family protein [Clostridiaceae bacterium]